MESLMNRSQSRQSSPSVHRASPRRLRRAALPLALVLAGVAFASAQAAPERLAGAPAEMRMAHAAQHGERHGYRHGEPRGEARGFGRMLERIGATDEQRARIEQISAAVRADREASHASARALREQMAALMAQPVVDPAAAEALRQQMVAQHDQASQRRLQTMLQIGEVLTPEQRAQIAEFRQARAERMQAHRRDGERRGR
jgi:periplasmic protein CpxP/Spy